MARSVIVVDFETYCELDITEVGAHKYLAHPSCRVLCMGYKIDDSPSRIWAPGQPWPEEIRTFDGLISGFGPFDCMAWHGPAAREFPAFFIPFSLYNYVDLRALCARFRMPQNLRGAGIALKCNTSKMATGKVLIRRCCVPTGNPTKQDFIDLYEYCRIDVEVAYEIMAKLPAPRFTELEQKLWVLTYEMNEQGVPVDLKAVNAILRYLAIYMESMKTVLPEVTDGYVTTPGQVQRIKAFCASRGVVIDSLSAEFVEQLLEQEDLPEDVRTVLEIRQLTGMTSIAKYITIKNYFNGGYVQGNLNHHGSGTGRWCLPPDAEVLTKKGWVAIEKWDPIHSIMQWEPRERSLKWCKSHKHEFDYSGKMVGLKHIRINTMYTPEHRMAYYKSTGTFGTCLANMKQRANIPVSGFYRAKEYKPAIETRLIVMVQADVQIDREFGARIRFKRQRKVDRCVALLTEANVPFRVRPTRLSEPDVTQIMVSWADLPEYFRTAKVFSETLFQHDPQVFIDEIEHWDGHGNGVEYGTTSYNNACWVQTMAHLCGYFASIKTVDKSAYNPIWNTAYRVYIFKKDTIYVNKPYYSDIDYSGKVYCPETASGFFLVRHNDLVHVTGNSGQGFQFHNLPRAKVKDPEASITAFLQGLPIDRPAYTAKALIRSMITAPPGYKIIISDYSSIENRILAWLCDDTQTMDLFSKGVCQYSDMAAFLYNKAIEDIDPKGDERQMGKVIILGCLGGDTKVITNNGIKDITAVKLTDLVFDGDNFVSHDGVIAKGVKDCINLSGLSLTPDHEVLTIEGWKEAWQLNEDTLLENQGTSLAVSKLSSLSKYTEERLRLRQFNLRTDAPQSKSLKLMTYDIVNAGPNNRFTVLNNNGPLIVHNCGYQMGAQRFQAVAATWGFNLTLAQAEAIVRAYRLRYPLVVRMWKAYAEATKAAVRRPGTLYKTHKCEFKVVRDKSSRSWLRITLPSGRGMMYADPVLRDDKYGTVVKYTGLNAKTHQMAEIALTPGLITENIDQAIARDVLGTGKINLRERMPETTLILSIHDEAGGLMREEDATEEAMVKFNTLMCKPEPWYTSLPLAAKGYIATRYKKE